MEYAYILINCQLGSEEEVIKKIKQIENVEEVHGVFGAYDIIVKLEASNNHVLRDVITTKIRKIDKISSTLTMTIIPEQE